MNLALVPCRSQKQSYMTISADVQQQAVGSRYESVIIGLGEKLFTRVSTVSLFIEKKKKSRNIKKEKERNN